MEVDMSSSHIVVQSAKATNDIGMWFVYARGFDVHLCNREIQNLVDVTVADHFYNVLVRMNRVTV